MDKAIDKESSYLDSVKHANEVRESGVERGCTLFPGLEPSALWSLSHQSLL